MRPEDSPAMRELASAGHNRKDFAVACHRDETLIVTGGESDNVETNWAWAYHLPSDMWHEIKKMNEARFNHGSVALGDELYAFGGYRRGPGYLSTIEVLDLMREADSWVTLHESTFTKRENPSICAIGRTQIMIMGGNDLSRLSDILVFDTETKNIATVISDTSFHFCCPNQTYFAATEGSVFALTDHFVKGACIVRFKLATREFEMLHERLNE